MVQVLAPVGGGSNIGEAVTLPDGGFFVSWAHLVTPLLPIPDVTDDQFFAVLGRVFNADGTPRGDVFQINESTNQSGQGQVDLAVLGNGNVVAVWTDGPDFDAGFDVAVRGRVFLPDGTPVTGEFDLSTETNRDQDRPQVVATADGGFLATWADGRYSNTDERFFAQKFDATGNRVGEEYHLVGVSTTEQAELFDLGNGDFHLMGRFGVTWDSTAGFYDFFQGDLAPTESTLVSYNGTQTRDAAAFSESGVMAVADIGASGRAFTIQFYRFGQEEVVSDGSFPDGTPFPDDRPRRDTAPDAIGSARIDLPT